MHSDITYVAILVAFFTLMLGLVRVCDRIIGTDDEAGDVGVEDVDADRDERVAA